MKHIIKIDIQRGKRQASSKNPFSPLSLVDDIGIEISLQGKVVQTIVAEGAANISRNLNGGSDRRNRPTLSEVIQAIETIFHSAYESNYVMEHRQRAMDRESLNQAQNG